MQDDGFLFRFSPGEGALSPWFRDLARNSTPLNQCCQQRPRGRRPPQRTCLWLRAASELQALQAAALLVEACYRHLLSTRPSAPGPGHTLIFFPDPSYCLGNLSLSDILVARTLLFCQKQKTPQLLSSPQGPSQGGRTSCGLGAWAASPPPTAPVWPEPLHMLPDPPPPWTKDKRK